MNIFSGVPAISNIIDVTVVFDGGGAVLVGPATVYKQVKVAGTILSWSLFADASGSLVIDVKKSTYSGFPTTSSIAASALPTLSSVQKNTDSTLTGWTTTIDADDVLEFAISGTPTTIKKATLVLKIQRT